LVTGLVPDAYYTVKVRKSQKDIALKTTSYRTLPDAKSGMAAPINIYFGGDVSINA
jgi:hypothetical protein